MRSAIYTTMMTPTTVDAGGVIPLGSTYHRVGQNIYQNGNSITMRGEGFYVVDVSVTVIATAAGTISATLYRDGVPVPGAVALETKGAAGDDANLSITAMVRNQCCKESASLTLVLGGTEATVSNVAMVVTKL